MRKLLIVALLLNAVCLFAICQPLAVLAGSGSGGGSDPCSADPTKYALDSNDDGAVDLSDFVYGLSWLFSGGTAPLVCLDTTDLEASLAQAQADLALPAPPSGFTFVERNAQGYDEYTHDSSGIRFVRLPGRSFEMGSPEGETGRIDSYEAMHTVWLTPFLIAKYEVKQSEYASVMTDPPAGLSATPSTATGANLPVEQVSWDDLHLADGFLARTDLSLPSEAQWEYACRAGTSGLYAGNGNIDDMGWYLGNSGGSSHDVGGKQANQFGLHDMHGNVYEWCEDVFKGDFYTDDVPGFDPVFTTGSGIRVVRGGHFNRNALAARSAYRGADGSDYDFIPHVRFDFLGFRPVRQLP